MLFCPAWIFDAAVSQAAMEFLKGDMPINPVAAKYAKGLSDKYQPISSEEIAISAESFIRTLDEVDAGAEATELLRGFCYFRVMHDSQMTKRNLKPLFGNIESGDKTQNYSGSSAMKRFKAYLFAWRSGSAVPADLGWTLDQVSEVPILSSLAAKPVNVLDLL